MFVFQWIRLKPQCVGCYSRIYDDDLLEYLHACAHPKHALDSDVVGRVYWLFGSFGCCCVARLFVHCVKPATVKSTVPGQMCQCLRENDNKRLTQVLQEVSVGTKINASFAGTDRVSISVSGLGQRLVRTILATTIP